MLQKKYVRDYRRKVVGFRWLPVTGYTTYYSLLTLPLSSPHHRHYKPYKPNTQD